MFEVFIPCIDDGENACDATDCEEDSCLERYLTANADLPTCLLPIMVMRIGESKYNNLLLGKEALTELAPKDKSVNETDTGDNDSKFVDSKNVD